MRYPSTDYDLSRILFWHEFTGTAPAFLSDRGLIRLGLTRVTDLQPSRPLQKWSLSFSGPLTPSALEDARRLIRNLVGTATVRELAPAPRRFFACAPSACGSEKLARRAWAAYPPTWHLDALGDHRQPGSLTVSIGVLDSGADATHPSLIGLLKSDQTLEDLAGHGTHIASTICARPWGTPPLGTYDPDYSLAYVPPGILEGREIFVSNISKPLGVFEVDWDRYLLALDYFFVHNTRQILNLSFGGPAASPMERDALGKLAQTTLLVAAAGNDAQRVFYPAGYLSCLSVAASTRDTASILAPFIPWDRNNGAINSGEREDKGLPSVDVYAPGRNIAGAEPVNGVNALRPAGFRSGTSMATAYATGVFGLVYSRHTITKPPLEDARDRLAKLGKLGNGGQHLVDLAAKNFF